MSLSNEDAIALAQAVISNEIAAVKEGPDQYPYKINGRPVSRKDAIAALEETIRRLR